MNTNTYHISFLKEALANLQLLFSFLLYFRRPDDFINRQNIKAIL